MGITDLLATLLPGLKGLRVEDVLVSQEHLTLVVTPRRTTACCPQCHHRSRRAHARFVRTLADLPWHGTAVTIRLHGRRFRCPCPSCPRQTFRERLPDLAPVYSRRTPALRTALVAIGFALGGQPGARLADILHLRTSRMTLLRLVGTTPGAPAATPRVLGVDDWSFRRGRTYGTILVDLERQCPVDLLPERTAETLANWLREHRGVEIISRDRGGAYADGARQGAPDAIQVADRFHLLKNLGDALEAFLQRKGDLLRQAATIAATAAEEPAAGTAAPAVAVVNRVPLDAETPPQRDDALPAQTRSEQQRLARRDRRLARYRAVVAAAQQGMTARTIARSMGLARGTVRSYLRAEAFPEQGARARRSRLAPYETYLREQWNAGLQNTAALWRAICAQGYIGSASTLRARLARWRTGPKRPGRPAPGAEQRAAPLALCAHTPRHTRWLLVRPELVRDALEQRYLTTLTQTWPQIARAQELAQQFHDIVAQRAVSRLATWQIDAEHSGIAEFRGFAWGLRRDREAVEAGLTLPWSQGQTEGQVNRLKTLKRQMYGRAKFPLLRQRLLHPA